MKSEMMKKVAMVLGAAFIAMGVTACNTTEGAGKDMKNAGQSIENAADRNK